MQPTPPPVLAVDPTTITLMDAPDDLALDDRVTIPDLLQQLADGSLHPRQMRRDDRLECVAYLTCEGFTSNQIAKVMRVSYRTVRRDRAALRAAAVESPDLTLGDQLLGELRRHTDATIQRLIAIAKDPETKAQTRVWANVSITRMLQRQIDCTARLKFLEDGSRRLADQRRSPEEKRYHTELEAIMYGPPIPRI